MSPARFIADQKTNYRVPHTATCSLLGISLAWFYKWLGRATGLVAANGLRDDDWDVSEKTVADSMRRQGLVARQIKRRNGLTRQDKTAPESPDLLKRNFTADRPHA